MLFSIFIKMCNDSDIQSILDTKAFVKSEKETCMHAVIFVGGTIRAGRAVTAAIATADIIIAADGGAENAQAYECLPAFIVGDFDSLYAPLLQTLQAQGSQILRVAEEKDETDAELALQLAREQGADTITILGGLGGERFDHALANIFLLAAYDDTDVRIVDGPSQCWCIHGPNTTHIAGHPGDLVSLFPLYGDALGVSTQHLYYPLRHETLLFGKPRGVSNVLTQEQATISLDKGILLIMYTDKQELKE
jgi:thiamine pyrophosphokinase